MTDKELSQEEKELREATLRLGEKYDSVRVFVTRHESGEQDGTIKATYSVGNWYASYGYIQEWMIMQDETARALSRGD